MKNITIAILAALVIVFVFLFFTHKNAPVANTPWPETVPAHTTTTTTPTRTNPTDCAPSIVVTNPIAGASYVVGQQVNITWTSCGVKNVYVYLIGDGKYLEELAKGGISASQGVYQWTVSNYSIQQSAQVSISNYQISIQDQSGSPVAASGMFKITTVQSTSGAVKTYSGNGFTIKYPGDVVVHEEQAEGGPYKVIYFGNDGGIRYVQNADFFEQYTMIPGDYTFVGTKVINGNTFKEYEVTGELTHRFWLKTGNTGYEIHLGDMGSTSRIDINTFNLI